MPHFPSSINRWRSTSHALSNSYIFYTYFMVIGLKWNFRHIENWINSLTLFVRNNCFHMLANTIHDKEVIVLGVLASYRMEKRFRDMDQSMRRWHRTRLQQTCWWGAQRQGGATLTNEKEKKMHYNLHNLMEIYEEMVNCVGTSSSIDNVFSSNNLHYSATIVVVPLC